MSAKQEPARPGEEAQAVNGQHPAPRVNSNGENRALAPGENSARLPVMEVPGTDISKFLALPGQPRRQDMRGFEPDYVDIVDYIVRITHRIWEEKEVGYIYDTYSSDCIVHTSTGTTYGRDHMVADTLQRLAAYPDLRAIASDVIWSGNEDDGFHSSHRVAWHATNTGWSLYGPPTNRRVTRMGVAHCLVKENRIVEEWLAAEQLNIIWGLGLDGHRVAREFAQAEAAAGVKPPVPYNLGEIERVMGQSTPAPLPAKPDNFEVENFIQRYYQEVWNWRLFNKVSEYCIPNYQSHVATNRDLYGLGDYKAYILSLMAAFPDLMMYVDHVAFLGDEAKGYRVAVRWWLQGSHTGPGHYGPPTGKRVQLLGFTHFLIKDGKFVKEWTIFDEFALLKQIYWPD